jgi:hypothetical protein
LSTHCVVASGIHSLKVPLLPESTIVFMVLAKV